MKVQSSKAVMLNYAEASMRSSIVKIKKHDVTIAGRKTSVTLEDAFWKGLRKIADGWDQPLRELIADIDAKRQSANLSSALRLFVLQYFRDELAWQGGMIASRSPSNSEDDAHLGLDFDGARAAARSDQ
jgi:predicted DNA-binding ribbon-helix-helix protein